MQVRSKHMRDPCDHNPALAGKVLVAIILPFTVCVKSNVGQTTFDYSDVPFIDCFWKQDASVVCPIYSVTVTECLPCIDFYLHFQVASSSGASRIPQFSF